MTTHGFPSAAAVMTVSVWCVAVVAASLAAPVSGAAMVDPRALTARGHNGGRVEDQEAPEMSSEAHRRMALAALQGARSLSYPGVLYPNNAACNPHCAGYGEPYTPNHCQKKYQCPE